MLFRSPAAPAASPAPAPAPASAAAAAAPLAPASPARLHASCAAPAGTPPSGAAAAAAAAATAAAAAAAASEQRHAAASHLTSLASVLHIVFGMSGGAALTVAQLRKAISALMPRLASQLGSDEAFAADLRGLPSVACIASGGGEDAFKAKQ